MAEWTRVQSFEPESFSLEKWRYENDGTQEEFNVNVTLGKPIDILSLKQDIVNSFDKKVQEVSKKRKELYSIEGLTHLKGCPVCSATTDDCEPILNVYGAEYVRCSSCQHYFVLKRPSKEALEQFYTEDRSYQSVYSDKESFRKRIELVNLPKVKWVIGQFEKIYGHKPQKILDIGAGSGHFVYSCRKLGLQAEGVELSQSGKAFAKENFDIELASCDFTEQWGDFKGFDVITFWGVIEHVPFPLRMLKAANQVVNKKGAVVAEVPRWNCFSTAVQTVYNKTVVRHLDPHGHINCFSDSSLATAFYESGLCPAAAWYFGMDAYELTMQTAHALGSSDVLKELGPSINGFQQRLDLARLSDEMVYLGTPK